MSSHHIVREDQEPALVIEDIQSIPPSLVGQLLEWSPTVIANKSSFTVAAGRGIKVDVLLTNEPIMSLQDHVSVFPLSGSFLDAAIRYLIAQGYGAANILSDQADPVALLQYADAINAALLGRGRRIFVARSGFSKWKAQGESICVYGNVPHTVVGLKPQQEGHYITEADGFYSIHFKEGRGVVGEQL